MAYTSTPTVVYKTISGRRHAFIACDETEAAAASEWSIALPARLWTLKSYHATLTAGTGTTINPILGRAAAFSSGDVNHIATQGSTAASINDQTSVKIPLTEAAPTLVVRSTVDAAADNTIHTEMVLAEGADI